MSSHSVSRKTLLGEPCCTAWTNIPRSPYVYEHLVMVDAEKVMPILSSKTSLETRDSNQQKISILAFGLGTSYNRTHSGWFCSLGVFFFSLFLFCLCTWYNWLGGTNTKGSLPLLYKRSQGSLKTNQLNAPHVSVCSWKSYTCGDIFLEKYKCCGNTVLFGGLRYALESGSGSD